MERASVLRRVSNQGGATCSRSASLALTRTLAAALVALGSRGVAAQGWSMLPNGNLVYMLDYTTSGMYTCTTQYVVTGCSQGSNGVTLTSGTAYLKIAFFGVPNTPLVVKTGTGTPTKMKIGTLVLTPGGIGPFAFPPATHPNHYLHFTVGISSNDPVAASGGFCGSLLLRGNSFQTASYGCATHTVMGIQPPPQPFKYSGLLIGRPDLSGIRNVELERSFDIYANAAVIPEPATIVLLGTGLLGIAGHTSGRRRRRSKSSETE